MILVFLHPQNFTRLVFVQLVTMGLGGVMGQPIPAVSGDTELDQENITMGYTAERTQDTGHA